MSFLGDPVRYRRPILRQKCGCGAMVEIDPDKSWSPNVVIMEWWKTHPCSVRGSSEKENK